jgi:hypothetical protein
VRFCDIEGCLNAHRAKGLCSTHYAQQWYGERGLRPGPLAEPMDEPEEEFEEPEVEAPASPDSAHPSEPVPSGDAAGKTERVWGRIGYACVVIVIGGAAVVRWVRKRRAAA